MLCTGFVKVRRHAASPRRSPTSCWIPCACEDIILYYIILYYIISYHIIYNSWYMLCTGFVKVRRHAASPRRSPTSCWIPCACEDILYYITSYSSLQIWWITYIKVGRRAAPAGASGRIPCAAIHDIKIMHNLKFKHIICERYQQFSSSNILYVRDIGTPPRPAAPARPTAPAYMHMYTQKALEYKI